MPLSPEAAQQLKLDVFKKNLREEFAGVLAPDDIDLLLDDSLRRLGAEAKVAEYVPLMAYSFTRERLRSLARPAHGDGEPWDVVFVSRGGGGRGKIAAALMTKLSDGHVSVHSAGTALDATIDPNVRTVLAEISVNPDEEFARPVTDEVLHAADVVVTLAHSVGAVDVPQGVRHEDWRIGDPTDAPIAEVRRIRDDIEQRVRALLEDLGVPVAAEPAAAGAGPAAPGKSPAR